MRQNKYKTHIKTVDPEFVYISFAMFNAFYFWLTRPTRITITIELYYYLSPGDAAHEHCVTSFDLHRVPYWDSERQCLRELEKHVPQINPKSIYMITTADDQKIPYRRLEGSIWPQIKDKFLDWHKTEEAHLATGHWILKEVSEAVKTQYCLEEVTERMDKLEKQMSRLRNDVDRNNRDTKDILRRLEYERGRGERKD